MQKQIAMCLLASMFSMLLGPSLSVAQTATSTPSVVGTQLTPMLNGTSTDPISVLAKWEMKGPCFDQNGVWEACADVPGEGLDDDDDPGAQFASPGEWGENMDYTVCAVVHGPDKNIANIDDDRVIAEIFYPDIPVHMSTMGTCNTGGVKNNDGDEIDEPSGGCGAMIEQNLLKKLTQEQGEELVCEAIQEDNNNLITWADELDYDSLCNEEDGELVKGTAAVYCEDKDLTWEDPAGDYDVDIFAFDVNNNQSEVLNNQFKYLETQGFDVDFSSVNYGDVKISTHKRIFGDKCFAPGTAETVRNVGNVRLEMLVAQDDMGLGLKTGTEDWNVEYDARVGDLENDWAFFEPFGQKGDTPMLTSDYTPLLELLDLSEIEEMDFSIHVIEKWPRNGAAYSGTMWLAAQKADFEPCDEGEVEEEAI